MNAPNELPSHLKKYVVEQNYARYTPIDQAVWRYILRQLVSHLSKHAHSVYESGLKKTGIAIDEIPSIETMSQKLEEFGWKAVPVSGFIPPAAFMEFQSLGYLPIASDMRSIEHAMYTPAPDIVHEAAGHAPIIADPEYAAYLKKYAAVAAHAIISHEDMAQYEAIRDLSDIKEDPDSTLEQIAQSERNLDTTIAAMSFVSEAAKLGRMNWWTAEYGMVEDGDTAKIFGAGLLSSPGESRSCLEENVQKIPLTVDCVDYSYDITEPQPHLFVAKDFQHLGQVLDEFAETMAFRRGGRYGLERALEAKTVNTVELSSGVQISGKLKNVIGDGDVPTYLQFEGESQISYQKTQLGGHGPDFHSMGYGTAVGPVEGIDKNFEDLDDNELAGAGFAIDEEVSFRYTSGVQVSGKLVKIHREGAKILLLTFEDCRVTYGEQTLFEPSWGVYDLAIGHSVPSVFGGPADRKAFGELDDFPAKVIPLKEYSERQKQLHGIYQKIRDLRSDPSQDEFPLVSAALLDELSPFEEDWLALLELVEIGRHLEVPCTELEEKLRSRMTEATSQPIEDGMSLISQLPLMHS